MGAPPPAEAPPIPQARQTPPGPDQRRRPLHNGKPSPGKYANADPADRYLKKDVDYDDLLRRVRIVDFMPDLSSLTPSERQVLSELLKIKPHIDAIYRRQMSGPYGDILIEAMRKSDNPRSKAALKLLELDSGPYDPETHEALFNNVPPYPKNGFFYPEGLTKGEFEKYVKQHPEQADLLLFSKSIIRRNPDKTLSGESYSDAYKDELRVIADMLWRTADKTEDADLRKSLKSEAAALLRDEYYTEPDTINPRIRLVLGAEFRYDDPLLNRKRSYMFGLYTKDEKGTEVLDKLKALIPEIGLNLPLESRYNPYLNYGHGGKAPGLQFKENLVPVNLIGAGGEQLTRLYVGLNLGENILLVHNALAEGSAGVKDIVQRELFGEPYDVEADYKLVLGHEMGHGILPPTKGFSVPGEALEQELGDLSAAVEEEKASLVGLLGLEAMAKSEGLAANGEEKLSEDYWAVAKTFVGAMTVNYLHKDPHGPYGKYVLVVYNLLKEKGGVFYDGSIHKLQIDKGKFPKAIREIAGLFLKIQAEGNRALAEELLNNHNQPQPEIIDALQAAKNLPTRTVFNPILGDH